MAALVFLLAACGQSDDRAYPDNDGPSSLEDALREFGLTAPPCDTPDIRYAVVEGLPRGSSLYLRFSAPKSCVDGFVGAPAGQRSQVVSKGSALPFHQSAVDRFGWSFDPVEDYQTYAIAPDTQTLFKIAVDTSASPQVVYLYGTRA